MFPSKLKINRWLLVFLVSMVIGVGVYIFGSYITVEEDVQEIEQHHELIKAIDNITRLRQIDLELQTIEILDNLSSQRSNETEKILSNMTELIKQNGDLIRQNGETMQLLIMKHNNNNSNSTLEAEGAK